MESQENRLGVSVAEAGRMIGVSRRLVEGYISTGRLPSRKLGSRRIVLVRDLTRFLQTDQPSASLAKRKNALAEENTPSRRHGREQA